MNKKCDKCEYQWASRIQQPKACPRCKRRFDYPKQALYAGMGELK